MGMQKFDTGVAFPDGIPIIFLKQKLLCIDTHNVLPLAFFHHKSCRLAIPRVSGGARVFSTRG